MRRPGFRDAMVARKLYELFRAHQSLEELPERERVMLERDILRTSVEDAWQQTRAFFAERDPQQVERGDTDPHHRMALVFRSYLGESSRWSIAGVRDRRPDYQIWCGPAMGAFNAWVKGSFLEPAEHRTAVQIARNLLEGAATITRAQQLRAHGVAVPSQAFAFAPRPLQASGD